MRARLDFLVVTSRAAARCTALWRRPPAPWNPGSPRAPCRPCRPGAVGSSRRFLASRRVCSDVPVAVHTRACSLYILYAVASWYVQRACCVALPARAGFTPRPRRPIGRSARAVSPAYSEPRRPRRQVDRWRRPPVCHRPSRRRLAARSVGLYYVVNFCLCWLVRVHPGAASARCAGAALWCVPCACCFVLDDQLNVLNAVCLRPVVRAAFSVSVCVYSGLAAPSWSAYIPCDPSSVRAAG